MESYGGKNSDDKRHYFFLRLAFLLALLGHAPANLLLWLEMMRLGFIIVMTIGRPSLRHGWAICVIIGLFFTQAQFFQEQGPPALRSQEECPRGQVQKRDHQKDASWSGRRLLPTPPPRLYGDRGHGQDAKKEVEC